MRRFRPNLLKLDGGGDGWTEDAWIGREVAVGGVRLRVEKPCTRCTMITRPQPGLDADVDMFRAVARHHAATFGVWRGSSPRASSGSATSSGTGADRRLRGEAQGALGEGEVRIDRVAVVDARVAERLVHP